MDEHNQIDAPTEEHRDYRFVTGLVTGSLIGAGLMMWLAPRAASEVRDRVTESARRLGKRASDQYQQVSTRVGGAVDEVTRKGQDVRDEVAEAVARGAQKVERFATAARSDRVTEAKAHPAPDRPSATPHSL